MLMPMVSKKIWPELARAKRGTELVIPSNPDIAKRGNCTLISFCIILAPGRTNFGRAHMISFVMKHY